MTCTLRARNNNHHIHNSEAQSPFPCAKWFLPKALVLKSLPTSNNCSVLWICLVTAHFWGFVPHHWQKQFYMGQGVVATLDFCKLQTPASTFSMTGHVPCWLQWQDNECHHSPQKAFYFLVFLVLNSRPTPGESQRCNILLPGWWQCKKRTYPKTWLISCSAPGLIGSMLLKAVSLHPCSSLQAWMSSDRRVVFGLVLCLPSTSSALAGSWCSPQEQPCQPPRGSANRPARNTCMEWKHPRSLATGKNFSSWTRRERREARQRELRKAPKTKIPRHTGATSHVPLHHLVKQTLKHIPWQDYL